MKNNRYIDLHLHTNASDGELSPAELVRYASKKRLKAIAVTDHDTVNGVEKAVNEGKKCGLEVIPGVEVTCHHNSIEFHLVGLFIDYKDKELKKTLEKLSDSRVDYIKKILKNLNRELKKNIVVQKYYFPIEKAISAVKKAGGVAILAHPTLVLKNIYPTAKYLKRKKLDGMECIYTCVSEKNKKYLIKMAKKLKLAVSGGSDWHGPSDTYRKLGKFNIPYSILDDLKRINA